MATASDTEREFHARILARDDLAFAQLCDSYYELVFEKVKHYNRDIYEADDTLIADAVTDSFIHYFNEPGRYQPEKQRLEYFLAMDAEGDLKNTLQKLKRGQKKFPKAVELDSENGNSLLDDDLLTPFDELINKEAAALLEEKLNELFNCPADIQVAQLMLAGERRSSEYALVLNLAHLPEEAQRMEIKKQKDRIDKVIRRKLRGTRDG